MSLPSARAQIAAHAVRVASSLTCRGEGCFGCCHGPVLLSLAEWTAIKPHVTRHQRNVARLVAGTIADYRCPLLGDDHRCTVYAERPLVCRSFNSTAPPSQCYPGQSGRAHPEPGSRRVLGAALRAVGVTLAECVELAGQMAALMDGELA